MLFLIFLRLGLTSFGGPVAHLAFFREAFVERRRWLSESAYADLVALCQFLPGPASSQVGMAIGLVRGGMSGAIAAWLGFTLPSAALLIGFGYGVVAAADSIPAGVLQGLKIAAVAVVAQAVWAKKRFGHPRGNAMQINCVASRLREPPGLHLGGCPRRRASVGVHGGVHGGAACSPSAWTLTGIDRPDRSPAVTGRQGSRGVGFAKLQCMSLRICSSLVSEAVVQRCPKRYAADIEHLPRSH